MEFKKIDEGKWFYFDESEESYGGVKIRLLSPEEEDLIESATTTITKKPVRGSMVEDRKTNLKEKNRMQYHRWIMDWKEVNLDGTKLACTDVNKALMMNVTPFARFVLEKVVQLADTDIVSDEDRLKNLATTSGGSLKA